MAKANLGEVIDVAGVNYTVWSEGPRAGTYFGFRQSTVDESKVVWAVIKWKSGRWYNTGESTTQVSLPTSPSVPKEEIPGQVAIEHYDPDAHARRNDPSTSKAGARSAAIRAGSHKARLLEAYFDAQPAPAVGMENCPGLTDTEAASAADLLSVGYWKRCSDLRNDGLIEPILHIGGATVIRYTGNGDANMVCKITELGMATLMSMKESRAKEPEHVVSVCITCGGHNAEHYPDCDGFSGPFHSCDPDDLEFDGECEACCRERHPVGKDI